MKQAYSQGSLPSSNEQVSTHRFLHSQHQNKLCCKLDGSADEVEKVDSRMA